RPVMARDLLLPKADILRHAMNGARAFIPDAPIAVLRAVAVPGAAWYNPRLPPRNSSVVSVASVACNRPARARGFLGHPPVLWGISSLAAIRMRKRSEALPIHVLRTAKRSPVSNSRGVRLKMVFEATPNIR